MTSSIRNLVLLLVLFGMCGFAQRQEVITNREVIEMLRAKVPEPTILASIELAAAKGLTNFETSTATIIDLRKQGASGDILNAMMVAPAMKRVMAPPPASPVPGLPEERGVYYRTSSGWTALPIDVLWPDQRGAWKFFTGVGRQHWDIDIPDSRSRFQIADSRPTFYLRGISAGGAQKLLKVASREDYRRVTGSEPDATYGLRFQGADTQPFEVTRVAYDIVKLQPSANLSPGEYVLASPGAPGQRYLMLGAQFGVGK